MEAEEIIEMRPSEKVAINNMAEKFTTAMNAKKPAPAKASAPQPAPARPQSSATATAPAAAARDDEPVPEIIKGKAAEEWKKLRGVFKETKAERDTAKAELAELKKRSASLDVVEATRRESAETKKQLIERDRLLEQVALDRHPAFRAKMTERLEKALREGKEAVGAELAPRLEQVLKLDPQERELELEKLSEGLSELKKAQLAASYASLRATENDYHDAMSRSYETMRQLQEDANRKSADQQQYVLQQKNLLAAHIEEAVMPELDGAEPELVESVRANVRRMVGGTIDTHSYVELFKSAARGQRAQVVESELRGQIEILKTQVQELSSATPPAYGTGGSAPMKQHGPPDAVAMGHEVADRYRAALNKRTAVNR